ncbi:MAG: energy-coupling factor ABC transporter permease [Firmicutes bacterium]|nr:energy-coupling factor ABC transporter permease [Bacillota bacterium]
MRRYLVVLFFTAITLAAVSTPAYAMHISEGILPLPWASFWFFVVIPFIAKGILEIKKGSKQIAAFVPLVGMVSAAVFIISAMPIPVPTAGTCSHPAGTGLAAILIGPFATVVATSISLLIQALFLAHGGITTWGANIFSMGIIGAFSGYAVFKVFAKLKLPLVPAAFLAGLISDWATYTATSLELALGISSKMHFLGLFKAILVAFIPTQLPLGILEGFAAAGFFAFVLKRRPDILVSLRIVPEEFILRRGATYEEAVY